jgi:hypothetical protein
MRSTEHDFGGIHPTFVGRPSCPRVARSHARTLEVAGEELLEILPAIDDVLRQIIQLGLGRVDQLNGKEPDDEKVIIYPTHLTSELVVLQPDAGVSFTIVLYDIARCSEALWEVSIMHSDFKCFWPWLFKAEVVSFVIITASVAWVLHAVLGLCIVVLLSG